MYIYHLTPNLWIYLISRYFWGSCAKFFIAFWSYLRRSMLCIIPGPSFISMSVPVLLKIDLLKKYMRMILILNTRCIIRLLTTNIQIEQFDNFTITNTNQIVIFCSFLFLMKKKNTYFNQWACSNNLTFK